MKELSEDERFALLRRHGFEPDPVIEAYKKDVDRSLLRENLRRPLAERCANLVAMARLFDEAQRARQRKP